MLCDINLQNKVRLQNKVPPAELTIALSAVVLRIAPVADANDDVKVMTRISELLAVFSTAGLFNTAGSFVLDSAKKHVKLERRIAPLSSSMVCLLQMICTMSGSPHTWAAVCSFVFHEYRHHQILFCAARLHASVLFCSTLEEIKTALDFFQI